MSSPLSRNTPFPLPGISVASSRSPRLPQEDEADKPYSTHFSGNEEEEEGEGGLHSQSSSAPPPFVIVTPSSDKKTKRKSKKKGRGDRRAEEEEEPGRGEEKVIILDCLEEEASSSSASFSSSVSPRTRKTKKKRKEDGSPSPSPSPSPSESRRKKKKEGKTSEGEEKDEKEEKKRRPRSSSTSSATLLVPSSHSGQKEKKSKRKSSSHRHSQSATSSSSSSSSSSSFSSSSSSTPAAFTVSSSAFSSYSSSSSSSSASYNPFGSSSASPFTSLPPSSASSTPPSFSSVSPTVNFTPHPSTSSPSSSERKEGEGEGEGEEVMFINMPQDKLLHSGERDEGEAVKEEEEEEREEERDHREREVEIQKKSEEDSEDSEVEREPTEEEKKEKALKNRNNVAKEILETEDTYVTSLKLLLDMYITPLRNSMQNGRGILNEEDLKRIFSTVELIYNLNNTLLQDLRERIKNWSDSQIIGDVFLVFAPMFKLYSDYVKNYAVAMVHLQFCTEKYSKFAQFLKDAAAANRQVLGIHTFLIMPVQRLPRYILLLNELKKNTPEDHPDRNALSKSVVIFQQVTDQVNKSIKIAENIAKITSIQSSLIGKINLVDPARKFVKEGLLTKITSRFIKECMFFLFNDVLIYTYPMLGYFQYKGSIVLGPSWLRDLQDTPQVKNSFQIVCKNKTYTVFATNPEIKKEWMTALQKQIDTLVELQPQLLDQRSQVKVNQRGGIWKLFQKGLSYRIEDFDVGGNSLAPPPAPPSTLLTATGASAGTPLLGGAGGGVREGEGEGQGRVGLFKIDDLGAVFYEGGWCKGSCCTLL